MQTIRHKSIPFCKLLTWIFGFCTAFLPWLIGHTIASSGLDGPRHGVITFMQTTMSSDIYLLSVLGSFFSLTSIAQSLSTMSARYPYPRRLSSDFRMSKNCRIPEIDLLSICSKSISFLPVLLGSLLINLLSSELMTPLLSSTGGNNSMGRREQRIGLACFSASRSSTSSSEIEERPVNPRSGERGEQDYCGVVQLN